MFFIFSHLNYLLWCIHALMGSFCIPRLRVACMWLGTVGGYLDYNVITVHVSQNPAGATFYRQLETTHLSHSVWSSQLFRRQSRLSLPLFCSVPAPLSLYGNSSFIQPSISFLSDSLLLSHTRFLIFTVGQQIHPSYQHISPEENEVGLEMHVPASDDFLTEVKVL